MKISLKQKLTNTKRPMVRALLLITKNLKNILQKIINDLNSQSRNVFYKSAKVIFKYFICGTKFSNGVVKNSNRHLIRERLSEVTAFVSHLSNFDRR